MYRVTKKKIDAILLIRQIPRKLDGFKLSHIGSLVATLASRYLLFLFMELFKDSNLPMTCPYWACSFAKLCNIRLLSVCRVLTSILRSSFSISSLVTRFLYLTIDSSSAEVWPEVGEDARFGTFFHLEGSPYPLLAKERVSVSTVSARSFSLCPS